MKQKNNFVEISFRVRCAPLIVNIAIFEDDHNQLLEEKHNQNREKKQIIIKNIRKEKGLNKWLYI